MTLALHVVAWGAAVALALRYGRPVEPALDIGPSSVAAGALTGIALFVLLTRRRVSRADLARVPRRRAVIRAVLLMGGSAAEEAIWRALVLAGLLPLGALPALLISSVLFAAAHVPHLGRQASVHVLTGAAFGSVYLATGNLGAAVATHGAYNVALDTALLAWEDCPFRPVDHDPSRS